MTLGHENLTRTYNLDNILFHLSFSFVLQQKLSEMHEFQNLDKDIEGSSKRWKSFVEAECPEKEKFPQEWKNKSLMQKLCIMRCLRPDRMSYAVR